MKQAIYVMTAISLALGATRIEAKPRGEIIRGPVEMRVVGGRIDGDTIKNPIVLMKNGSVLLADKAIIMGDRIRFEGSPELRHARNFLHTDDRKGWIEVLPNGQTKMSPGKWVTEVAKP